MINTVLIISYWLWCESICLSSITCGQGLLSKQQCILTFFVPIFSIYSLHLLTTAQALLFCKDQLPSIFAHLLYTRMTTMKTFVLASRNISEESLYSQGLEFIFIFSLCVVWDVLCMCLCEMGPKQPHTKFHVSFSGWSEKEHQFSEYIGKMGKLTILTSF